MTKTELSDLHCKIPKVIKHEMEKEKNKRSKRQQVTITDLVLESWELYKSK